MRPDIRIRLQEITRSISTGKTGVAGVPSVPGQRVTRALHPAGTPSGCQKDQLNQRVTPVTPCNTREIEGGAVRYTPKGVAAGVTAGVAASDVTLDDWLAHFDERAGIMEFDGRLGRAEAERRALSETIAALGPSPSRPH